MSQQNPQLEKVLETIERKHSGARITLEEAEARFNRAEAAYRAIDVLRIAVNSALKEATGGSVETEQTRQQTQASSVQH